MPQRILLAEDDPEIQSSLAEALGDEGYVVDLASNGRSALRYLENGYRPDVIILDLMMPVMNGWAFRAVQLAEPTTKDIPVVLLSAGSNLHLIATELQTPYYMKKPVEIGRLFEMLREIEGGVPPPSLPSRH
jgi:CheY-like chemotaxis protein